MEQGQDIIGYIKEQMPNFSKGQRAIARYLAADYDKAAFMTAGRLGREAGVSESTVVRFAMTLGYEGYPQLQEALASYVTEKLKSIQKIDIQKKDYNQEELISYIMNSDMVKIRETMENLNRTAFSLAIERILEAENIYIIGIRNCSALAEFLGFNLNLMRGGVKVIRTSSSSEIFEQLLHVTQKDAVIALSFPRYSLKTINALEYANAKNASVITITDSEYSPVTMYSSCNLCAKSDMSSVADSLTAAMSLINALITVLSVKMKDVLLDNMQQLENLWHDYTYDDGDEMDMLREDAADNLERLEKRIE